jgi:hypothetical protein
VNPALEYVFSHIQLTAKDINELLEELEREEDERIAKLEEDEANKSEVCYNNQNLQPLFVIDVCIKHLIRNQS